MATKSWDIPLSQRLYLCRPSFLARSDIRGIELAGGLATVGAGSYLDLPLWSENDTTSLCNRWSLQEVPVDHASRAVDGRRPARGIASVLLNVTLSRERSGAPSRLRPTRHFENRNRESPDSGMARNQVVVHPSRRACSTHLKMAQNRKLRRLPCRRLFRTSP
jgi:hypothetical protein